MKKILFILLYPFLLIACDDGNICPKEKEDVSGTSATIQIRFSGQEAWPQAYKLVFAGFGTDTEVPLISKIIPKPGSDSTLITITLNGLTSEIKTLNISLLNKGRSLIQHFYSFTLPETLENISLPIEEVDLADLTRVQKQVFAPYCTRCHGAGNHAAADLDLTEGNSRTSLINMPSAIEPAGTFRVVPGKPAKSFLYKVLLADCIEGYNHTDVLPDEELLTLIETWIKYCK